MFKESKMSKYLTTKELSELIKMTPGTIRNLVYKGTLKQNVHYVKPTPRKLLFKWKAIEIWLHRHGRYHPNKKMKPKSLINI